MEIKPVSNEYIVQLIDLNVEMYKEIDPSLNAVQAVHLLMNPLTTQPDFLAIGLYDNDILIGFVTGWASAKNVFYFSGIYVIIKNNEWTKKLIDFSFDFIKERGYTSWECDATNPNISSILEKYGATVKYTRYTKEL